MLKRQLSTDLKSGERGSSRGARRIYSVLVAGEVALACALLVSSALLVRTVGRMMDTPTGVDADTSSRQPCSFGGRQYQPWRVVGRDARAPSSKRSASNPACRRPARATSCRSKSAGAGRSGSRASRRRRGPRTRRRRSMHSVSEGYFEAIGAHARRRPGVRGLRASGVGPGGDRQRDVSRSGSLRRSGAVGLHHHDRRRGSGRSD